MLQASPLFDIPAFAMQGSAQRAGHRLRMVATLQEAGTGRVLWAHRFDGNLSDVFDLQDEIAETLAARIEPQIERAALARSRRKTPGDLTAHDFSLRALPLLDTRTKAGNREALLAPDRALELDPGNVTAIAQALRAPDHRFSMAWQPLSPEDTTRCVDLAAQAQAGAEGDAVVLIFCATAHLHVSKDYAPDLAGAALDANPNAIRAFLALGVVKLHCGDPAATLVLMDQAMELSSDDPLIRVAYRGVASAHLFIGAFDDAMRAASRARSANPNFDPAYRITVAALAHLGRPSEAAAALDRLRALTPGVSITRIRAGQPGRFPEPLEILLDGLRRAGLPET